MSYPPQRFFSLSSSTNSTSTPVASAQSTTAAGNTSKFIDRSSLDLLVRAANTNSARNTTTMEGNNMSSINNLVAGQGAAAPGGTPADGNAMDNNNLQQAFLQTMQTQAAQAQGAHPSAIFGTPGNTIMNAGNPQVGMGGLNAASAPVGAQQFGQLFGNMGAAAPAGTPGAGLTQSGTPQATTNGGTNTGAMAAATGVGGAPASQAQGAAAAAGGTPQAQAQASQQGNMISQLVASLQAQQQAQQQAQVQAALVRAFGPGANAGGMNAMAAAGMAGGIQAAASGATNTAGGGVAGNPTSAGMAAAAPMSGMAGLAGGNNPTMNAMQDLNSMGGIQGAAAAQGTAARDLLSRMQLAQSVQQQQQQAQQQQQQQQNQANMTNAAVSSSNATADDLIKLQLEQERHNRMLQMVQADRQERAMLANQEALMKKQRKDLKTGTPGTGLDATVSTMFNQFPANSLAAAATGFPNASAILTNAATQFANAQGLQNGLMNPAAGILTGLGETTAEQHLHQKLGSARGAAIVPCRARGMPVDHNFKTAYFVIPDGIEHGDELMCSYPACRQAGVKFRYCLHCKVPVAKRNFRNRHRHGVPGGDGASASDEEVESEEEATETTNDADAAKGDICQPVNATEEDEDYTGVKKEHVLIIPGAEPSQTALPKKKKKKNTRVPCRARGMPMAHNFKTAYFHIPSNIEHGDELLCSFPSCRSAGAKFRYCLHCKVPVAKRNFRNRHKHGNLGGLDKKKSSNLKTPESPEEQGKAKAEGGDENKEKSLVPELPKVEGSGEKPEEATEENEGDATSTPSASPADGSNTVSVSSTQDAGKVQKWVELLENKPNPGDKQAMAVWMMSLMNATEGGAAAAAATDAISSAPADDVEEKKPAAVKTEAEEEAPAANVEEMKPAAAKPEEEAPVEEAVEAPVEAAPVDALAATVAQAAEAKASSSSVQEEEGSANSSVDGKRPSEGKDEEEGDASSMSSGSSQPPKKKFKQDFEEV